MPIGNLELLPSADWKPQTINLKELTKKNDRENKNGMPLAPNLNSPNNLNTDVQPPQVGLLQSSQINVP